MPGKKEELEILMPEKCLDSGRRVNERKARYGGGEETRRLLQRSGGSGWRGGSGGAGGGA